MFAKLFVVLALAVAAQCIEYPAGVHPAVCPNYPYCDMSLMGRYTMDGLPIPEWVNNPFILPVAPVVAPITPEFVPAARYPAGVDPAFCPNYPYCK